MMQILSGVFLTFLVIEVAVSAPTETSLDEIIEDTTDVAVDNVDETDRDTTGIPFLEEDSGSLFFGGISESRSIGGSVPDQALPIKEKISMFSTPSVPTSSGGFTPMQSTKDFMSSTKSNILSLAGMSEVEDESPEEEDDNKEYDDYDYKNGALPPSLPNLEIIPFVAADAVRHSERLSEGDGREAPLPVIPAQSESRAALPLPVSKISEEVTSAERTNETIQLDGICLWNGTRHLDGQVLLGSNPCLTCKCQSGDVVCQETQCPPTPKSCIVRQNPGACCGAIVCESGITFATDILSRPPTLLRPLGIPLPAFESTLPSEKIGEASPFKDVIKFHPAPKLEDDEESKKNAFYVFSSTEKPDIPVLPIRKNLPLAKVQSNKKQTLPKSKLPVIRNELVPSEFKLGGCNIYGRMYKVNKIVDELSGPCTLCRCTDNGVQCNPISC